MPVYFLAADGIPAIKVGVTMGDPRGRLSFCQTFSPVPLKLLAVDRAGDDLTEAEILFRFRDDRLHGEWITATAELRRIVSVTAQTGNVPGGWYMTPEQAWRYRGDASCKPSGGKRGDISKRFGISLNEYRYAVGVNGFGADPDYAIPLSHVPRIFHWLTERGHQVDLADLLHRPPPKLTVVA